MNRILLIDLAERELQARTRLKSRFDQLQAVKNTTETTGGLSTDQQAEMKQLHEMLDSDEPVDAFYRGVASEVSRKTWATLAGVYDEKQLIELCLLAGHYVMLAGALNSLGVARDEH